MDVFVGGALYFTTAWPRYPS